MSSYKRLFVFPWRTAAEIDRDVDDELDFHLRCRITELERRGLEGQAAHEEALRQFGDIKGTSRLLKQQGKHGERLRRRRLMWDELSRDTRYALRSLAKKPGFTAIAILVLGLGIGATSAMFSLVNVLLMKPLLIDRPDELVGVYHERTEKPGTYNGFSYPLYQRLAAADQAQDHPAVEQLAAFSISLVGVREGDQTRRRMAGLVSANFFEAVGPLPQGRGFTPRESQPGQPPVAVVSHNFFRRRGSDPSLIGSQLWVNGESVTVIGITPPGFTGTSALLAPDLWLPIGLYDRFSAIGPIARDRTLEDPTNTDLMLFARLPRGASMAEAEMQLARLGHNIEEELASAERHTLRLASLPRVGISTTPRTDDLLAAPAALLVCMGGVVLLIACLNLANMFLARGMARRTEIAIRLSLGGGRWRLLRQQLTEGLVLALLAGGAGLILAYWTSRLLFGSLAGLLPEGFTIVADTRVDLNVIVATLFFCLIAALLSTLGPAWKLTGSDLLGGLRDRGGIERGARGLGPRNFLIVAQIALSLVLLTAAGLFTRGAFEASEADPGFPLEGSLLAELDPGLLGYTETQNRELYRQALDRLRSLPGVSSVSLASLVPFGGLTAMDRVVPAGAATEEEGVAGHHYAIADQYFATLGLPILRGRDFNVVETGEGSGAPVVIIDEPLAERLWPDEEALGRQIRFVGTSMARQRGDVEAEAQEALTVIGVVPGVRHELSDQGPTPHLYLPLGQDFTSNLTVHLRLDDLRPNAEAAMLQTVRNELRSLDPQLPILSLKTFRQHRDSAAFVWLVKMAAKVFAALGIIALFLALVGVYGVKTFVVARRTREIGIRMAIGATARDVLRQLLGEGLRLTLVGLASGLVLSLIVAKLLTGLLYEVKALDPVVFVVAPLTLTAAALIATYLPARKATRVAPTQALHYE